MAPVKVFNFMWISFTILVICLHWSMAQQLDSTPPCMFPFIFKGVQYTECTTIDEPEDKLWCSTKTDSHHNHIGDMGYWKHCTENLKIEQNQDPALGPKCPEANEGMSWTEINQDGTLFCSCSDGIISCEGRCEVDGLTKVNDEKGCYSTCAGGWLEGDVWLDSNKCRHVCNMNGKILTCDYEIVDCVADAKWNETNGDDSLYCICHSKNPGNACDRNTIECAANGKWKDTRDDLLRCICRKGNKLCGHLPATTCVGGRLVGDVWGGGLYECMDIGILESCGGAERIIEFVSGDTNRDDLLRCICHEGNKLCGHLPATTCAGGRLVGDVWEASDSYDHYKCMDIGIIMVRNTPYYPHELYSIVECASGDTFGDTWKEIEGGDTLHCICRYNRKFCMNYEITGYLERSCGGLSTECENGVTWTEEVGNDTLHGICLDGGPTCMEFKPTRPLGCVEGDKWVDSEECFTSCIDGRWAKSCPPPKIKFSSKYYPTLLSPRDLAPIIPPHLNYCKVLRGGEKHFADYNEKCKKCEHCEEPCHIFNTRTCNCRRKPFCKN